MRGSLLLVLLGLTSWGLSPFVARVEANQPALGDLEFFEKKIRPVLVKHCYECHSAGSDEIKGELIQTRELI